MFVKDNTRLKLSQKADFHSVRASAFTLPFLVILSFLRVVVTGGSVVHLVSSSLSPNVPAKVLGRVDVCRARVGRPGRAISFLDLVFAFALSPCLS